MLLEAYHHLCILHCIIAYHDIEYLSEILYWFMQQKEIAKAMVTNAQKVVKMSLGCSSPFYKNLETKITKIGATMKKIC